MVEPPGKGADLLTLLGFFAVNTRRMIRPLFIDLFVEVTI
jgi:hypothetical protein